MFVKTWSRPLKRGAHVDGGGTTKRRILATLAIAAMTVTNLGAGALAAPAANAQELAAVGSVSGDAAKALPKVVSTVEGNVNRWEGKLEGWVENQGYYTRLDQSVTKSTTDAALPADYDAPEFTGPIVGTVGPIAMVGSTLCLEGTTTDQPGYPSSVAKQVILAECDDNNPRQEWIMNPNIVTSKGVLLNVGSANGSFTGQLSVGSSIGLFLSQSGNTNSSGLLDPVEQTADLVIESPIDGSTVAASTMLTVSGTGKPGATVVITDEKNPSYSESTVVGGNTKWELAPFKFAVGPHRLKGSMAGKPAEVSFSVGNRVADPASSEISADLATVAADGESYSTVTVVLKDASGTVVGNDDADFAWTVTGATLGEKTKDGLGTYTVKVSSAVAGPATVGFTLGGEPGLSTGIAFVPGDVDFGVASGTNYQVSTGDVLAGSGSHAVTVVAKDAKGNGVPLANPATQITAGYDSAGGFLVAPFAATSTAGVYKAVVTSASITSRAITVEIDGQPVTAVTAEGEPVNTASFIAGPADLENEDTGFTVTEPSVPVVDGSHTVTVELVDGTGLPVTLSATDLGKLVWTAAPDEGVIPSTFTAVNGTAGSYSATIRSTKADTNTITVALNGVTVNTLGNDQAAFHADTPATGNAKTNYQVTDTDETVGTGKHTVTIRMFDANNNPVENLKWTDFVLTAAPDAGVAFDKDSFVETDQGVYTVKVSSTSAGSKKITVALAAGGSLNPAKTGEVTANIHAAFKSAAVSTGDNSKTNFTVTDTPVVVGGHHIVTVKLADEFGNPVTGLAAAASLGQPIVTGDLGTGVPTGFIEDPEEPGTFTATITSTQKGDKLVEVKLAGATVLKAEGGNDTAVFTAGTASALESSLALSAGPIHANGVDKAVATVTLKDKFGNAITSVPEDTTVVVTVASGTATVSSTVAGTAAGTFTADITSETAGEVTVSFTVNGENADASETVEFLVTAAPGVKYANGFSVAGTGVKDQQIVIRNSNGDVVGNGVVGDDGKFLAEITGTVANGEVLDVVAVDPVSGFESSAVKVTVDSDVPGEPYVKPSNGSKVEGTTKPGSSVVVKDEGDNVLCETTANESGEFSCVPNRELGHGEEITVEVTDASGNKAPNGSVVIDTEEPDAPILKPSNGSAIEGEAEAGSVIVITGKDDVELCRLTVPASGEFSCIPKPTPGDGDTITATATDLSGNTSEPGTVVIDKQAPKEPVVDPSNGSEITGTTKPDSKVTVKDEEDNILCETVADKNGDFSCVPDPKPGHGEEITVEVVDPSGNQGETPGSVVIDKEAPKEPVVDPSNGDEITGNTKPGSSVTVKDDEDNILCETVADKNGDFSCVPDPKPGHGEEITVEVVDPSGNKGEQPGSVIIDKEAPKEPVVDPSNGDEITGTTKPGSSVTVKDEEDNILCETVADKNGDFSCVPNPKPGHGEEITVEVVDPSGNKGEQPGSVIIDKEAPKEPVVDPSNGSEITGTTKPDSKVTVKDEEDNILCETVADENGKFSCVPDPKPGHGDKIIVEVVDPSGNQGEKPGSVVIDKEAPKEPAVDPSNGSEIKGETKPGSSVTVKDEDDNILCETVADKNGKFSCVPDPRPEDGDTITVEVVDPSGNKGEKPGSVVIDRTPPNAPVVNPSNGSQVSGTGEAGAKAIVTGPNGTVLCETTVNAKGQFVCVPQPKPEHGATITVTLTDPSGNVSEPGTVTINTVPPTAPIVDVSNGKKITGGVIDAGNTVAFVDGKGNRIPGATVVDPSGRFTFTPAKPLAEGADVRVVVTDPEGNITEVKVQFITTSPDRPVVKPSDGDTVTGCATPGSTVTVRDASGNVIGTAVAGDDCKYTVTLSPKQDEGKMITVEVTDQAGNSSGVVSVRVGLVSIVLEKPELQAGDTQTAYGYGFQPGEKVTGVLRSTPVDLGTQVADADGSVKFTFKLANDIELGEHSVTLSGDFSGSAKETFMVAAADIVASPILAVTGGDLFLPLSGAVLLLIAGIGLVAAKRRQRSV